MKYWKSAILFSFVLFFDGCAATTHTQAQAQTTPHRRPFGFWENEKAVVQVLHIFSRLATDDNGNPILDAKGKFTTKLQIMLGTGAVVDVNGLVMTNNHIIEKHPVEMPPVLPNQPANQLATPALPEIYTVCRVNAGIRDCDPAEVVAADAASDLALLHTNLLFPQAVKFVDDNELVPGDEVYFWGNVFSFLPPSPFFGHYVGRVGPPYYTVNNFSTQLPLLLMDINVSPGSSGSPVFNELGEVVGMANAFLPSSIGGRSLGITIPSSTAIKFLKESRPKPKK